MNRKIIPIKELIEIIESNKYIDCDEVDKYEEIYEYASILYYLKKYIRLNNIISKLEKFMENRGSLDDYNTLKYLKKLKENKNG